MTHVALIQALAILYLLGSEFVVLTLLYMLWVHFGNAQIIERDGCAMRQVLVVVLGFAFGCLNQRVSGDVATNCVFCVFVCLCACALVLIRAVLCTSALVRWCACALV